MSCNPLFSLPNTSLKPCLAFSLRTESPFTKKNKEAFSLFLGKWELTGGQHVCLYSLPHRKLKALIYDQQGLLVTEVKESHIRGGLQGQMSSATLHKMLREIERTRLAAAQVCLPHQGLQLFFFPQLRGGMKGEEEEVQPSSQKGLAHILFTVAKAKEEAYQACKEAGEQIEALKALKKAIKDYERLSAIPSSHQKEASQRLESLKQDLQRHRFKEEAPLYLANTKAHKSWLLGKLSESSFDTPAFKELLTLANKASLADYFVKAFACEALEQREEAANYYYKLGKLQVEKTNLEVALRCFKKAFDLNPPLSG